MSVTVKFGANVLSQNVAGRTVDSVKEGLQDILSMDGNEEARVNNAGVADGGQILADGDVVEFVKAAGEKG